MSKSPAETIPQKAIEPGQLYLGGVIIGHIEVVIILSLPHHHPPRIILHSAATTSVTTSGTVILPLRAKRHWTGITSSWAKYDHRDDRLCKLQ